MQNKKINIGTTGWNYKDWQGRFYPADMQETDWLAFYAERFNAAEIVTTFYHMPKAHTVKEWAVKAPKGFKFCPKMSRYLTHMKKLQDPEDALERFFEAFEPVKHRLGPILLELSPAVKFNAGVAEHLFELFKKNYKEHEFVLEVADQSWMQEESLAMMRKYDVGFVISQSSENDAYSETITGRNIYVRFNGPEELYASSYADEMLQDYAKKFKKWVKDGHVVWAFFNNDINGHALSNAETLSGMLGGK
jgi:uncharacterized protein YecE (DUF72 family)